MAVNLSPVGGVAGQFFTNNGTPLAGGKIYTYAAGATINQATYTSSSGGTAHTNPIILDSAGRVPSGEIWLTDGLAYKFVIADSSDVLIGTYDNVVGINSNFVNFTNQQEIQTATAGQTVFTLTTMQYQPGTNSLSVFVDGVDQYGPGAQYAYVETNSTTVTFTTGLHVGALVKFTTSILNSSAGGDALNISYAPPFIGSVTTNVGAKLAQTVSVKDFGAVGNGIADDTAAIQAALAASNSVYIPSGTYLFTSTLDLQGKTLTGAGRTAVTLNYTGSGVAINASGLDSTPCVVSNFNLTGTVNATAGLLVGKTAVGCRRGIFSDLYITGFTKTTAYGLDIEAKLNAGVYYNLFQNVGVNNCANGIRVYSSDGATNGYRANSNTFINCSSNFATVGDGVFVDYANANTFIGLDTEQNTGYGVQIDRTFGCAFFGGYTENNTLGGVNITANAGRIVYLGRRTIDAISGSTALAGDLFSSDSFRVDPSGNVISATIKNTGGLSISNANVIANTINVANNDVIAASGTSVVQLTTTQFKVFKPQTINGTQAILTAGAGSPEGVITAVPGSLYTNTSGGAGTTLYVKQSGTGNTGWVAK